MKKKFVLLGLLCIPLINVAQFNSTGPNWNKWGRTDAVPGNNIKAIGIGNFTTFPKAALHVNTNLLTPPTNQAATFFPGEVFRTDCPEANTSTWKMFRGPNLEFIRLSSLVTSPTGGNLDIMIENRQRGAMLFGTAHVNRMIILDGPNANLQTGFVGIGNNFYAPTSQLHLHDGTFDTYMQVTNSFTGASANDGLRIGILGSNGDAVINQQEDADLLIRSGAQNIPINQCNRMQISSQTINSVTNQTVENITRVSIHESGHKPILNPRSLLHLGFESPGGGSITNNGGWRPWMDVGTFTCAGSDNIYIGFKKDVSWHPGGDPGEGDFYWSDIGNAIINWGDNITTGGAPDNLCFVFTQHDLGGGTIAESDDGLEIMRMTPFGFVGIGNSFNTANGPLRRLDIHHTDDPQLRLSQTISENQTFRIFTDFQTTGLNNSYSPDNLGTGGHLLINPRNKDEMRVVAINMEDANTPDNLALALDVNGQQNIRTVNNNESLTRLLVVDPNNEGRIMWRDANSLPTGGGNDHDFYETGTINFPSSITNDVYRTGATGLGFTIANIAPARMLEVQDRNPQLRLTFSNGGTTDFLSSFTGHLYIQPSANSVLINHGVGGNITPFSILDVNGNGTFRDLPDVSNQDETLLKIVAVDNNGTLKWRDVNNLPGIGGNDYDWEKSTNGLDVFTGHPNAGNLYPIRNVGVGVNLNGGSNAKLVVYNAESVVDNNVLNAAFIFKDASTFNNNTNSVNGIIYRPNTVESTKEFCGVRGEAWGKENRYNIGVRGYALNGRVNYGVYTTAQVTDNPNSKYAVGIYADAFSSSSNSWAGWFNNNINVNGIITNVSTFPISDIKFKNNIAPISDALSIINQINPVNFDFNTLQFPFIKFPDGSQYGIIAQELEAISPSLVKEFVYPEHKDTLGNLVNPEFTYKGLNYTGLIPIALKGIQELDEKINNLPVGGESGWSGAGTGNIFLTNPTDKVNIGSSEILNDSKFSVIKTGNSINCVNFKSILTVPYPAYAVGINNEISNIPNDFNGSVIGNKILLQGNNNLSNIGLQINSYNASISNGLQLTTNGSNQSIGGDIQVLNFSSTGTGINVNVNGNGRARGGIFNISGNSSLCEGIRAEVINNNSGTHSPFSLGGYFSSSCFNGMAYGLEIFANSVNVQAIGLKCSVGDKKRDIAALFEGDVQVNGKLYANEFLPGSDAAIKKNIQPISNAINIINQLQPKSFNYRTDEYPRLNLPDGNLFGLVAQDVEAILPSLVKNIHLPQELDSLGNIIADSLNYKALNYTALVPVLIQGLKEVNTVNDSLKSIIVAYETRFANIETILANCCQNPEAKTFQGNTSKDYENTEISSVIHITPDNSVNGKITELYQNNPNPFTVKTTFTYTLGKAGFVELEIHSEVGQFIAKLVSEQQAVGNYSIDWNTANIAPGIYFYSLKVDNMLWVKKAVRIK